MENYEKAIECAKTYLLFHPEEEVMNQNVAYYSAVLGEEQATGISAREVVLQNIRYLFAPQVVGSQEGRPRLLLRAMPSQA